MQELITVIINVYNREKFIKKCIDSVINQTYKNIEILIINDGSTDKTLDICKSYKDKRIKIITTKNQGLSLSRNVGIDNATGSYLYFVDSDDYIELDTIEFLYNLCKKYNSDFSTCEPLTIYDYSFTNKQPKKKDKILDKYEMLKKVLLAENSAGTTWNKLIKKELYNNIRFEKRIVNDVVVTYKLVLKANKIVYSNQRKYYYLKHDGAVTKNGFKKLDRTTDYYKAVIERYEYIKTIYPNMIENDMGLLRAILKLYLIENETIENYLKKQHVISIFKKKFSLKMIFADAQLKEKTKILLFRINPKLYKKIGLLYRKKYKIKI